MNNKKSYIEIMNELEKIIPSPKDFDYSKANKEEITNKIISFLKSITPPNLIIALDEFNRNDNNITSWNSKIFDGVGRLTSIMQSISFYLDKIINEKRFNDDAELVSLPKSHQYIYSQIGNIKEMIYDYILNYLNYNKYMIGNENIYKEQFGNTEEIEEYIERDNIENYIKKAFDIKRYNYESYDLMSFLSSIKDIMVHYGINDNNIDLKKIEQDLIKAIEKDNNIEKDIDILRIEKFIIKSIEEITQKAYYKRTKKEIEMKERQRRMEEMLVNDDMHPINKSSSSK